MIFENKQTLSAEADFTITLDALSGSIARESTAITTDGAFDILFWLKIPLTSGTPSGDKAVLVYAYGGLSGSNAFGDNATGSNANITLESPTNLNFVGMVNTPTAAKLNYISPPFSLRQAFGTLPETVGIVVENKTGLNFSTGSIAKYRKLTTTSTRID